MSNVHDHPIPLLVWKNFPSLKVFNDLGKCGIEDETERDDSNVYFG